MTSCNPKSRARQSILNKCQFAFFSQDSIPFLNYFRNLPSQDSQVKQRHRCEHYQKRDDSSTSYWYGAPPSITPTPRHMLPRSMLRSLGATKLTCPQVAAASSQHTFWTLYLSGGASSRLVYIASALLIVGQTLCRYYRSNPGKGAKDKRCASPILQGQVGLRHRRRHCQRRRL